jgi:hypothetical protein
VASSLRLGPGPLPAFGVNGLGGAGLAEQLVGAALVQQRQQLLPGGKPEGVGKPAGAVTEQHGAMQGLTGSEPVMAWLAAWGSAAATQ